jgi:hypothetical protein
MHMEYISLSWSAIPLPGLQRLTGTAYPSGASEVSPIVFIRGSCWSIFSLWVVSEHTLVFNIKWTFMLINCRGQGWICVFHVKHNLDFSTNYPWPSITHGKITRVEKKLKLSVLLAKEDYQFGNHNRSSVWVSIFC